MLGELDPVSRALLDLSLRRGLRPEEIAGVLGTDEGSVVEARDHALDVVADELGIEGDDRLDQVRALLAELPADEWSGVAPIVGEDEAAPADDPGEELDAMATAGPDTALFEEAEYELETDRVLEEAAELEHDRLEMPPEYVPREELAPAEEPDAEPETAEDDEPATVEDPAPATAERRDEQPEKERRPRRLALLGVLTALVAVGVLLALLAGGDDDTDPTPRDAGRESIPAAPPGGGEPQGTAARLEPVGDAAPRARATARLTDDGRRLTLSARGLPAPGEGAYTVWLYNSVIDARPLGNGRDTISLDAKLPDKLARYRFVDVSFEPADRNPNHSGRSVLRVPTEALLKE